MLTALRSVPGLIWMAAIWVGLAWWAENDSGLIIALFCGILGLMQVFRRMDAATDAAVAAEREAALAAALDAEAGTAENG